MPADAKETQCLPFSDDRKDFEDASRGLVATLKPCVIKSSTTGRVVWDNDQYEFLQRECPPTANPSLWRQSQLCSIQGLFEVCPGIYQVRGFDISNMTLVEAKTGILVIDPLTSMEPAAAALQLYRTHRGPREVVGLVYTHSHIDHLGGAAGVLPSSPADREQIPIIAPKAFVEEFTSENVHAGESMLRRARYMYGSMLPKGPEGQIGCGLGMATSAGKNSLIPPNHIISKTGEELTVDGILIRFQMVSGTEAPSEFNLYFPHHRALLIAECATHTMHNIITLRGALVRDSRAWSRYLDDTLALYGNESDVLFSSHHWPTWGKDNIQTMLSQQRDLYAYMHDQTLRMINRGLTGTEIAEAMVLPRSLREAWHCREYYGSVSHNVKGIHQRYMTWFDGNPAHLWQHPRVEEGKRYVESLGGIDATVKKGEEFAQRGDHRFAATLLDHAVAAEPTHQRARSALAAVYEKLGYGAENATWRNFYLTGAQDMRKTQQPTSITKTPRPSKSKFNTNVSISEWLDKLAIQLDGLRAEEESLSIIINITDQNTCWRLNLSNGALTYRKLPLLLQQSGTQEEADLALTTASKEELFDVVVGKVGLDKVRREGDGDVLWRLMELVGEDHYRETALKSRL